MANDINRTKQPTDTDPAAELAGEALWDTLKGNWTQMKGRVKEKWGLLTNDDLTHISGHKDRLVGILQEKYGKAKLSLADIERELRSKVAATRDDERAK